jgi:hypothetical protein
MFNLIKITQLGLDKHITPNELLFYQSMGWREVQGADPKVEIRSEEIKTPQTTTRKYKKETSK